MALRGKRQNDGVSAQRWLPYDKVVIVRKRDDDRVVVRPRRMSPWRGAALGTSLGAGIMLSAAISQAQIVGFPTLGSLLIAGLASVGVAVTLGKEYGNHPERWRFLGWWMAFLIAKVIFAGGGFWVVMPIELLALWPALRAAQRTAILRQADLSGADMRDAEVSFLHFKGTDFQRANFRDATFSEVVFEGCRLNGLEGEGVRFYRCKFYNCQFQDARLSESQWRHSDARGSLFMRAILRDAAFDAVDLRTADFENADFQGAKFQELEMVRTRLEGARLAGVRYDDRTVWSPDVQPVQAGAVRVN